MKHGMTMVAALGLSLTLAAGGFAQDKPAATPVAASDKEFMAAAAQGGMAEVSLGKMAMSHGSSPAVKAFGKRMMEDHSMASQELTDLAKTRSVKLPPEVKPSDKALYNRLSKLQGAAFDKLYMSEMVRDHTEDVGEFKRAAASVKDADLKNWVTKTLPTLEDHLKLARETYAGLGGAPKKGK